MLRFRLSLGRLVCHPEAYTAIRGKCHHSPKRIVRTLPAWLCWHHKSAEYNLAAFVISVQWMNSRKFYVFQLRILVLIISSFFHICWFMKALASINNFFGLPEWGKFPHEASKTQLLDGGFGYGGARFEFSHSLKFSAWLSLKVFLEANFAIFGQRVKWCISLATTPCLIFGQCVLTATRFPIPFTSAVEIYVEQRLLYKIHRDISCIERFIYWREIYIY